MATAGPILKEAFDSRVGNAISKRNTFYSWFRRRVEKDDDINARGYMFAVKTQRNQGYGSLTGARKAGSCREQVSLPAERSVLTIGTISCRVN